MTNTLTLAQQRQMAIDIMMKDDFFKDVRSLIKQDDDINNITNNMATLIVDSPSNSLIEIIDEEYQKEIVSDIWGESLYKKLAILKPNNRGNVGEKLIQRICEKLKIKADIDGPNYKKQGCDGIINSKKVEIKTSVVGTSNKTFQHELGKNPWNSDYMIFVDVALHEVYITIFKNFTKENYEDEDFKSPVFKTVKINKKKKEKITYKKITCRDGRTGDYKLDTTIEINENCIKNGYCIKFDDKHNIKFDKLGEFINKVIITDQTN